MEIFPSISFIIVVYLVGIIICSRFVVKTYFHFSPMYLAMLACWSLPLAHPCCGWVIQPIDYQDNEGFCGWFGIQWGVNGGKCGVCGDGYDAALKEYEAPGGKFANSDD